MMEPILFTPREAEIVTALFQLGSRKKVEAALGLKSSGLTRHLYNIYQKAGVSSSLDLFAIAYRNGGYLW